MSNTDQHPAEMVCENVALDAGIQVLESREVPLGGLRAMPVRRTLPQRKRSLIGAWCFLDHYGPDDVAATGGMRVDAHPHIGLQTVSWLFSGEIEHRDSAGFHAMVRPGELNLMTAGNGISHSERSTAATTVLHGAQLWVALPEHARSGEKTFEHFVPPVTRGPGFSAQVFLGSLLGAHSPVVTHTALVGAEIRLDPGASLSIETDETFEYGVLLDSGELQIARASTDGAVTDGASARTSVAPADLAALAPGTTALHLHAGPSGARLLVIGGEPLGEQIIMWWNFVARTHEEIAQARADWQAQIQAAGVDDVTPEGHPVREDGQPSTVSADRFGLPEHEPAAPLPAPPLPTARLKPRE